MVKCVNGLRFIEIHGTWYLIGVSGLVRLVRLPLSLLERAVREETYSKADTMIVPIVDRRI